MENDVSLIDRKVQRVGQYTFDHKVSLSSKISDYDYDVNNPNRRFISTYIHTFSVMDLCGIEVCKFKINSESLYELITNLIFKSKYNQEGNIVSILVYGEDYLVPYKLSVTGSNNGVSIIIDPISMLEMNVGATLFIQNKDLDSLISMLKMEGSEDDYV